MAEADPRTTFNIHEAKTQFSRLVRRAHDGEEIIVARDGEPYARLMPLAEAPRIVRKPGRYAHLLQHISAEEVMAPCFTDEELDEMENASLFPPK